MTEAEYPRYVHISFGGPERIMGTPRGPVRFEMHRFCGPMPCRLDGTERRVAYSHPFWSLIQRWVRGGEKADSDGRCIVPPFIPCPDCHGTGRGERVGKRSFLNCKACLGTGEPIKLASTREEGSG